MARGARAEVMDAKGDHESLGEWGAPCAGLVLPYTADLLAELSPRYTSFSSPSAKSTEISARLDRARVRSATTQPWRVMLNSPSSPYFSRVGACASAFSDLLTTRPPTTMTRLPAREEG